MSKLTNSVLWKDVKERLGVKRMPKKVGDKLKRIFSEGNDEGKFDENTSFLKSYEVRLDIAFYWESTKEGHYYWSNIWHNGVY